MEHTKLPWTNAGRAIFKDNFLIAEATHPNDNEGKTTYEESCANSDFIIKCVNNHQKLVDALEKLIDLHNYQESEGPKPTYEQWKTAFESAQETLNEITK